MVEICGLGINHRSPTGQLFVKILKNSSVRPDVCRVLEIKCKDLMQDDETESKWSVHVPEPTVLPHSTDKSDNSQTTNLLGCKKTSKMESTPDFASVRNVVDVVKVVKEVIPRNTNFKNFFLFFLSRTMNDCVLYFPKKKIYGKFVLCTTPIALKLDGLSITSKSHTHLSHS